MKNWPGLPNWMFIVLGFGICVLVACKSGAQDKGDSVGRKAAEKYFKKDAKPKEDKSERRGKTSKKSSESSSFRSDHFMAVHVGGHFSDESFAWGSTRNVKGPGKVNAGVTYRIGEWTSSMDLLFRGEWTNYDFPEGKASKLSFLPMVQFPEASSGFPLYFGGGVGLGVFTKQIADESVLSLDYQLVGGARWFNIYKTVGAIAEFGLKNHFLILSSGQFDGLFLSVGLVFTF